MNTNPVSARRRRGAAGFTLVELMVVVAIIAALAAIVGVNVIGQLGEADVANAKAQIRNFKTALIGYKLEYKKFPSTSEGLEALLNNPKGKKFLDASQIPDDPWGNPYVYTSDAPNKFKIVSYGADGRPGGTDESADIDSDNLESDE